MKKIRIALMYDFDKTLSTTDMQDYMLIPSVKLTSDEFWEKSNILATSEKMDRMLSYMRLIIDTSINSGQKITREQFVKYGSGIELFEGVETWFERINNYCNQLGIEIEHYIISSGLKEIIEGSSIAKNFKQIFACEYMYDKQGNAIWPKVVVNYTGKTQFLFRINKQVLDVSNDRDVNRFTAKEDRPIPFENMIYFGDGLTDVPIMKLLLNKGGKSIAVYAENNEDVCRQLLQHKRISSYYKADYTENGELELAVKKMINAIKTNCENQN